MCYAANGHVADAPHNETQRSSMGSTKNLEHVASLSDVTAERSKEHESFAEMVTENASPQGSEFDNVSARQGIVDINRQEVFMEYCRILEQSYFLMASSSVHTLLSRGTEK